MNNDTGNLALIFKALKFAAYKHKNQRRKDVEASPYINHPIALADILINEAQVTDFEVICGALLHDTIEDTETSPEEIELDFGQSIRAIVEDLTDDKSLPKDERKRLQIEHAAMIHPCAKLVKLADKISNLRDINEAPPADWDEQRKLGYFNWAREVVMQLQGTNQTLESLFFNEYEKRISTK